MKPLLSRRIVLLIAAIAFVGLLIWFRANPEKPEDPLRDAVDNLSTQMGLDVEPMPSAGMGLEVKGVRPNTPGDRLGFRVGDRIRAVGDRSIWHALGLYEMLSQGLGSGRPVSVIVQTGENYHQVVIGRGMGGGRGRGPAPGPTGPS